MTPLARLQVQSVTPATVVKLRSDHETPIAPRSPSPVGPRVCQVCGQPITMKSGKYGKETCSPQCRNVRNGQKRSARVQARGYAEQLSIAIGQRERRTETSGARQRRLIAEGKCRRCGTTRDGASKAYCAECLARIAAKRAEHIAAGRCRECRQPRDDSTSTQYCASCLKTHNDAGYRGAPRQWTKRARIRPEDEPLVGWTVQVGRSFEERLQAFLAQFAMTRSQVIREAVECYMDLAEDEERRCAMV